MWKSTKRGILRTAAALNVPGRLAESRWRHRRLAILCYHGVSLDDEHEWDPRYYVSPALLEMRLRMLRDGGFSVLPLDEAVRRLYEGGLPERSAAITFDDGCYDFYHRARPLLKQFGYPATVYLTTFYCYHQKPVFRMFCHYLMWKGRHNYRGQKLLDLEFTPDLSHEAGRTKAAAAVIAGAERRGLKLEEKDALAEELAGELGVDYEAAVRSRVIQVVRPEEAAEMAAEGWDIQLHTHRHRTPEDRELFLREIDDNRRAIRDMTGSDARTRHFCYPSGFYSLEFLPWLEEAGVVSATTCETGLASPEDHPLLLPRIVDHGGVAPEEFEGWLTGFSQLMLGWRKVRRAARIGAREAAAAGKS